MRAMVCAFVVLLAGCAGSAEESPLAESMDDADGDGFVDAVEVLYGTDPFNATSVPDVMRHEPVAFSETATDVVGTGVPGRFCDGAASDASVRTFIWSIPPPSGNVSGVHVAAMEIIMTSPDTVRDADLFLYGPDGTEIANARSSAASETITVAKHGGAGDFTVEVRGCSGTGDIEVEGTALLGWTPSTEELLEQHDDIAHGH